MQILLKHNLVVDYCAGGYIPLSANSVLCEAKDCCFTDCTIVTVNAVPSDIDYCDYEYIEGNFIKLRDKVKRETFFDSNWVTDGSSYRLDLAGKCPIVGVYRLRENGTASLVTNVDVELDAEGSWALYSKERFNGYVLTL